MSHQFEGKTAIVTGSSRGIGRAIAERLADGGADVVINYVKSEQRAQEVVNAIRSKGRTALAIRADVSKPAEIRRLFDDAERALGKFDIVVANAGTAVIKPLVQSTEEDYDRVVDTNTKGVFFTLQEAARRIRDGGHSSSRRPAAQRCSLRRPRFISATRAHASSSSARSLASSDLAEFP